MTEKTHAEVYNDLSTTFAKMARDLLDAAAGEDVKRLRTCAFAAGTMLDGLADGLRVKADEAEEEARAREHARGIQGAAGGAGATVPDGTRKACF